jgi:hypothetical protein
MSRKNFKVATTEDGKTTLIKIDKTPTGKVKTLKDKEAVKAAREEQYKNFRIAALKRRAKRMGLSEEQTNVKVKELEEQLKAPTNYSVLIWYDPKDYDMMKESIKNEDMAVDIMTSTYLFITVDSEGLGTLRSIAPPTAKIYPHVKRKPNVLPTEKPRVRGAKKHTKAEKKALATAAKKARKALNRQKGHNVKSEAKERLEKFMRDRKAFNVARKAAKKASKTAVKKASGTTIPKMTVKRQASLKKASTLNKAA